MERETGYVDPPICWVCEAEPVTDRATGLGDMCLNEAGLGDEPEEWQRERERVSELERQRERDRENEERDQWEQEQLKKWDRREWEPEGDEWSGGFADNH